MKKLILDTNLLIYCFQNRIDLLSELRRVVGEGFELCVPERVVEELKRLDLPEARMGITFLAKTNHSVFSGKGYADDAILSYAKKEKAIVATNDAGLKARLAAEKLRVISVRGKNKLAFV